MANSYYILTAHDTPLRAHIFVPCRPIPFSASRRNVPRLMKLPLAAPQISFHYASHTLLSPHSTRQPSPATMTSPRRGCDCYFRHARAGWSHDGQLAHAMIHDGPQDADTNTSHTRLGATNTDYQRQHNIELAARQQAARRFTRG